MFVTGIIFQQYSLLTILPYILSTVVIILVPPIRVDRWFIIHFNSICAIKMDIPPMRKHSPKLKVINILIWNSRCFLYWILNLFSSCVLSCLPLMSSRVYAVPAPLPFTNSVAAGVYGFRSFGRGGSPMGRLHIPQRMLLFSIGGNYGKLHEALSAWFMDHY